MTLSVDELLKDEYIAGGNPALVAALKQSLPQYVDEVDRDYPGTYEKMLTDPIVASNMDTVALSVLADGIRFEPAVLPQQPFEEVNEKRTAEADEAATYVDFFQSCVDDMDPDLVEVAKQLLVNGLMVGSKVAEIVLKPGTDEYASKLVPKALKPKPRRNLAYVVDEFMTVLGLLIVKPGVSAPVASVSLMSDNPELVANFLPREKVILFNNDPVDGDPRGRSILRAAYNAWWLKTQVLPEYYKFLKQFATPGIVGKTPKVNDGGADFIPDKNEDGTPAVDETTGSPKIISSEVDLFRALLNWLNGSVLVVKGGTEIDFLQSEGDGQAFLNAADFLDRQITVAMLGSARMTMEAQHGSKKDSEVSQDVTGLRIAYLKGRLAAALFRDFVRPLVRRNWGDKAVRLAPKVVLARVEQQDWASELKAVADAYAKGYLHESQLPELDARMSLPQRDMEAIAREKAERQTLNRMAAGDISKIYNPSGDGSGKDYGPDGPLDDSAGVNDSEQGKNRKAA